MTNTNEKLIIYGHDYCGQARRLARTLNQKEIEYEWRDIHNGDPAWKEELRSLAKGYLSVPTVVFLDGKVMVEPWPEEVLDHLQNPPLRFLSKITNLSAILSLAQSQTAFLKRPFWRTSYPKKERRSSILRIAANLFKRGE